MPRANVFFLGLAVLLAACGSSDDDGSAVGPAPGVTDTGEPDDAALEGIVAAHNAARAEVGVEPLTWSTAAAEVAAKYAAKCIWGHNADRGDYGENLFAATGAATASGVVESWVDEKADYDAETGECASGKVCGHYTQVVWSRTTAVGCAKQACSENSPFGSSQSWEIWVCNYAPPGNYVGEKAF